MIMTQNYSPVIPIHGICSNYFHKFTKINVVFRELVGKKLYLQKTFK